MGNYFSSKSPKISSKDIAILELKVQRDKLKQYEKKLILVIDRELEIAKQQLKLKNHHAARLALSKKKYQEQLLAKTSNQLMTIEQLTQTIEYALVEQDIINRLQLGNTVLSQIHDEMGIEKVEKIMEDTADGIAYQKEIQDMISQNFNEEDEQDIMDQLDKLVEDEVKASLDLPEVPKTELNTGVRLDKLPDVPTHDLKQEGIFVEGIKKKQLEPPM
jgi:charged multivesicular body protein 6